MTKAKKLTGNMDGKIIIVSGEGTVGTPEIYTGKRTRRAMRARLTKESCGGDRWAFFRTPDGERIYPEQFD
jgi:hypothetical protein